MRRVTKQRAIASAAFWSLGCAHVKTRLILSLVLIGLLAVPTVASAATKNGITPTSPKAGKTIPVGKRPTLKGRVNGPGQIYVHVCKNKKKDKDGIICPNATKAETIKRAKRTGGKFSVKPTFFDFPEFWLNAPGTYYWQAYRIACEGGELRLPPGRPDRQGQGRLTVRIGCSGWNYASWKETFYPPRLPARRWLEHYATQFDTVEVNATFYRLASPSAVDGWVHHTPPEFVFAVKSSRYLTHMKRLTDMDRGVGRFYDSIAPLAESPKLGPVLWQLPDRFARDDERLAHALSNLPPGRHAFELRHPSWFAEPVFDLLRVARRRVRAPRRQAPARDARGPDRRLHVPALPLRPPRPPRELLRDGAPGVGLARARARARGRRLRVLQQRLGGVRSAEREAIASLGKLTARRGVEQPGSSSGS